MQEDTHFVDTAKVASYAKNFNHVIFLDEVVSDSSYYRSSILTLKTASPDDNIEIIFNTEGGASFTASVFVAAMRQCQAKITGNLSGLCASAGTSIALNCDDWIIGEDLAFMVHANSYGGFNSAEKLRDQMSFMDKWNSDTLRRDYEGFLTEEELVAMIESGKEYWFNADDTAMRLDNYKNYHMDKHNKSIEDEFLSQCDEEDALVEQALAELNIPVEHRELFEKINSKLEEYFSKGGVVAEESTPVGKEASDQDGAFVIENSGGAWTVSYLLDEDGDIESIRVYSEEVTFLINGEFLSEYTLESLKGDIADVFEIPYVHNTVKGKMTKKIIDYFEMEVIEHLSK